MDYNDPEWPIAGTPERISRIELNQICDIADLAREDPDVIKLWIGEGDLPTPDFIKDAAVAAMQAGHTRYTYSHGVPALRAALDRYHKRHWNVDVGPNRFSVTAGGVQAIMQAFQAIISPGDEVIVPVPAWPNLVEIIGILGGTVVPVPYRTTGSGGFTLDLDDVYAAVTPRTRAIAINSPSNPTGWIMPKEQMVEVRDFARERGLWIVSDEVYCHFTYDGTIAPSFLEVTEPTDRLLITNTFSKNWCMTGWRIGWLIYPEGMSTVFDNLSQYNTTSVSTFSQYAAVAALDQGDDFIRQLVERSARGREIICATLDKLPNVKVFWPQGTFYFFFSVRGMNSGYEMARRILREAGVGVAPGSAFGPGSEQYLRVCFAVDPALIAEGASRLEAFLRAQDSEAA
ncbi:pyridoxal phosphate-dependent aminotransferase (plasmid) [Shinella sp. PSBB067]|uniref:pyridoxal phosphate-dependent aminotransferase n=1 Tax=Shinella sp. PSBB067 TaxID=2715959 RepID=UPI00193C14B3|nr:pyridoxal phosphate-dependent aminotransferase [Shinella sp. PSBB067]QRI66271.1 pyridoxal phosphate-dependent aminotransferase [Shinella sp. PSBB067]